MMVHDALGFDCTPIHAAVATAAAVIVESVRMSLFTLNASVVTAVLMTASRTCFVCSMAALPSRGWSW